MPKPKKEPVFEEGPKAQKNFMDVMRKILSAGPMKEAKKKGKKKP